MEKFPDQLDLLKNMLGILGNVAEVEEWRGQLMTEVFVDVIYKLLDSEQVSIEVSYGAVGILKLSLSLVRSLPRHSKAE